ncbi:NF-kappa-B essential modulator-like, partial [Rhincodon typus]|uniref:NF-kappa-B essential modulator-like n=1 Tax=Rhincodon typus TaxID=259920 RepID=UPI00202FD27E
MSRGQGSVLAEMVQPGASLGSEPETMGEEAARQRGPFQARSDYNSLGALLQLNRDLQAENASLREAIRQSNLELKERCGELQDFQARERRVKEFVVCRFRDARLLVEQLRAANSELRRALAEGNKEGTGQECASGRSSMESCTTLTESTVAKSLEDGPSGGAAVGDQVEGNEFVRLLKARKEELEEDLKKLREQNRELQNKLAVAGSVVVIQTRIAHFEQQEEKFKQQEAQLQQQKAATEQKLHGLTQQLEVGAGPDASMIFVSIGYGFFVELTFSEALRFLEKKTQHLN